jgi:hypothetical protein
VGEIELGSKVRDSISGFSGILWARTRWLFGCVRVAIQSTELDKDGNPKDPQWFDEAQVDLDDEDSKSLSSASGGPRDECIRASDPRR